MSSSLTFVASWVTFCVSFCCSSLSLTRKRMSSSDMPELLMNSLYALSVGKACFFWSSKDFFTDASLTSTPCSSASCSTHSAWIRNSMTSRLSVSYSCSHCFLSAASDCFFWPFGSGAPSSPPRTS